MTAIKKLKELNLDSNTMVRLKYSDGVDVFHYNETEIETALAETNVVDEFA